jgi:ankyrin repeat protein
MSGKRSGHFDQSLNATSSKAAKEESRRCDEEADSNDVHAAIEGRISEHNVLCSSGGNLRDKRQRTGSCLENTVDAPDRDSSTKDGSILLPLHHEISFEGNVRSTATPSLNRVSPASAAPSAFFMSCLKSIRENLFYSYSNPVSGVSSCVFLSPWSTLGQRTFQFMRVLEPLWCLTAQSSRAAKAALHMFSSRKHLRAGIDVQAVPTCSRISSQELFYQQSLTVSAAPLSADLDMWRVWLLRSSPDMQRDRRLLKARNDADAAACSAGLEFLCDVTWGQHVPLLLLTPRSSDADPYPVIVHNVGISWRVRMRMFSALATLVSVRLLPTNTFCHNISKRHRLADIIIARIYSSYRQSTEQSAVHLFDQCLSRLRHAKALRSTCFSFTDLSSGRFSLIRERLRAGDVILSRAVDHYGRTVLHYCSIFDNVPVAQVLVAACADLDAKDKRGISALSYSVIYNHESFVRLLIEARADVNSNGVYGWCPLHFAAKKGRIRIVELLIEAGANVNAKTANASCALHVAAEHGQFTVALKLVAAGAIVNQKDCNGLSALHVACDVPSNSNASCWVQVVHVLLDGGANVNDRDVKGRTALHHAINNKTASIDLVKALVAGRADLNLKNKNGKSPLQQANSNPFISHIAEYLRRVQEQAAGGLQRSE